MKKKIRFILPLCAVLCLLYVIFASQPLAREIQFTPVWTVDAGRVSAGAAGVAGAANAEGGDYEGAIPFKMGQTAGYFTRDGKILSLVTFPYKATVSAEGYAVFGMNSAGTEIHAPDGSVTGTIAGSGFPFFDNGRKYLFRPGGSSFAQLNDDGSVRWEYEYYAPITAFSSSAGGTVAGFADGVLVSFDGEGNIDKRFSPGGSEYPVILGAGISESGTYVAAVSGQNEQRFIVAKQTDGHTSIIFHKFLDTPTNTQVLVKFSKKEDAVYYVFNGKIGVVNCRTLKDAQIPIKGSIVSIKESEEEGTVFVLSKDGGTYSVSAIEPFAVFAGSFSFEADSAFIAVQDGSLFVGRDSKISRIDIHHR